MDALRSFAMDPTKKPSLIDAIGADCTCWPDVRVVEYPGDMIEVEIGHVSDCARLTKLKSKQ
tara:strand:- start:1579 stop:1764 length:186 start_codon:yes stop_codon:yes gene_type:complete